MQHPKTIALILVLLISFFNKAMAQGDIKELAKRIGNIKNFSRIDKIAKEYFKEEKREEARKKNKRQRSAAQKKEEEEEEFENAETFYHRWALINGSHLDAAGNITNYTALNMEAIAKESAAPPPTQSFSSNSNWVLQGPSTYTATTLTIDGQGRVDCIAFHPTDANTMYAGTPMGGLYKTTNGGSSWFQVSGMFPFLGIAGIVVNSSNGDEVWALAGSAENPNTWGVFAISGGCRVYHSTDGGVNWVPTNTFDNIGANEGRDLIQDPLNSQTLYAATSRGIYRTTDGGGTWTYAGFFADIMDLEVNPSTGRVFAASGNSVRYTDNGTNWSNFSTFSPSISSANRLSMAFSPTGTFQTMYILAGPGGSGIFLGLYRSTDNGVSFTRRSNTPNVFDSETDGSGNWDQSGYDNCIVAHPTDALKILTGGSAVWQSSNGGTTMTFNTYYWNSASQPTRYVHPDIHTLKINPLNNKVWVGTDGGLWSSTDFGANWAKSTNGIAAAQIFHFSIFKNNSNMEAFGSQDNGVKIRRNAGNYEQFSGADGYAVEFSLNDSSVMYSAQNNGFTKFTNFGTSEPGCTYPFLDVTTPNYHWYILPKVTPSSTNTEILFAASRDTLSRSTTGGSSWTRIVRRANWDIEYAPSNPAYIYTAGGINYSSPSGFTLSRNTNYGTGTWTDISGTLGSNNQRAMKFAIDPFDEQRIYVCLGGYTAGQKVFRSVNGGTNWSTNISYNLPNVPVNAIAADKAGNIYAGTDIGVYVLPSGTTQWVAFYNNLPRIPITELLINEDKQFIKAATFGCGIWKSDLYGGCPISTFVSFTQTGQKTIEASDLVTGFQTTMSGGYDFTQVLVRSGNYIVFTPGSDLKNGSLRAYIGPCGEPFEALRIVPIERKKSQPVDSISLPPEPGNILLKDKSKESKKNEQPEKPEAILPINNKKKDN